MTSKKVIAVFLAVLMAAMTLVGFAGCGSTGGGSGAGGAGGKDKVESVFPFETDKLTTEMATAYWTVLNQKINGLGILDKTSGFTTDDEGVQGGYLLDMNNDGIPELVVCSFYHVSTDYGYNSPALEVYTYSGGEAYGIFGTDLYGATAGYDVEYFLEKNDYNGFVNLNRHTYQDNGEYDYEDYEMGVLLDDYILMDEAGADIAELEASGTVVDPDDAPADAEVQILVKNESGEYTFGFENNAQQLLSALASRAALNAETFLKSICYYGDRSKCVMTKEMAEAYAEVIEGLPQTASNTWGDVGELHVMLADPNNDGMPILITSYLASGYDNADEYGNCYACGEKDYGYPVSVNESDTDNGEDIYVYGFENGKAVKVKFPWLNYGNGFGTYNGKGALINQEFHHDAGNERVTDIFTVENGMIKLAKQVKSYDVVANFYADGDNETYVYGELPADANYTIDDVKNDISIMSRDGWAEQKHEYDGDVSYFWSKVYEDGKDVTSKYFNMTTGMALDEDDWYGPYGAKYTHEIACVSDASYHIAHDMTASADAIQYLREYAKVAGKPSYNFPEVAGILTAEEVSKIAEIVAKELKGEVGEIFRISDDLYYVIIYVDGEPAGGVLVKNSLIEESGYRVISSGSELYSEAELNSYIQKDESVSNITLNYSEAGKNKVKYLEEAMTQIDGTTVNDAAKGQIVTYVQSAVTDASTVNVKCSGNSAVIDGSTVTKCLNNTTDIQNDINAALDGVTLNKTVDIIIRVMCKNMDAGETAQVTFDASILDSIGIADEIQVILGEEQHGISISTYALQNLIAQYGQITVQVQKVGEATYDIVFVDAAGNKIDQISDSLAFTMPAPNEMATVFATYSGGSDNWGGQFDGANKTIEFSTPYSGKYEIIDNAEDIKDITELDQQTSDAIKFMVSKGYFAVDESGNFNPDETLNRYMFVEALVRMFFTTDHTLTTSFTDVPEDSSYYTYVASGQKDNIVEGISETKFGGNQEVTREQIIALCARTLADKKGYTYPENPDEYLTFTDADRIGGWARNTTALAVREGLIDRGGELAPKEAVSRDEAALMLYKLFMLLYETSAENVSVSTNVGGGDFPVVPVVGGAIVLLAAAGGGVFFMKKKKGAAAVAEGAEAAVEDADAVESPEAEAAEEATKEPAEAEIAEEISEEPTLEETETESETSEDDDEVVEIVKREVENVTE